MGTEVQTEVDGMVQGQANIWQYIYRAVDSMALRCAVELRIADIINSHGCPISLSQIAHDIASPLPDMNHLARLMRFLVHKHLFDEIPQSDDSATRYSLNHSSKWLLHDSKLSLSRLVLMFTDPSLMSSWHGLDQCIKEGGTAFEKTHGHELWDFASLNPEFNRIFNEGMVNTAQITTNAIISEYAGEFGGFIGGSLLDVGGGTGIALSEIVKAYPHLKGINFDLPHVVATAPKFPGVTHVGGDMFSAIPPADVIFMKWIMHCWSDEDCVKILKNCRKAIPEETGKVIIIDVVLQRGGLFADTGFVFDMVMLAFCLGGKERTEVEWKKLLEEGGFPRYKIIKIPALQYIIEAYPK